MHAALFGLKNGRTQLGPAHRGGGGRGGDAGHPGHRRAAGRGPEVGGKADPGRRRPAARQHRARRAVHRAAAAARRGGNHRGHPPAVGLAAARRRATWPRAGSPRPWRRSTRPGRSPGPRTRTARARRWWTPGSATPRPIPTATRFVFAYTNRDVDALNAELRQVRRDRGELAGPDVRFETKHGPADFAPGDRVQFTDTDKRLHIYNGNAGTITGIDARDRAAAPPRLDGGREVSWSAAEFARVPARLCRDDLQGAGQDPGPHLPLPHARTGARRRATWR